MSRNTLRKGARLAAVQALYEMEIAGKGVEEVLEEFTVHWIGRDVEDIPAQPTEEAFFTQLVTGVVENQRRIDTLIDDTLVKGWPLYRIEMVLRAILRAGTCELLFKQDIPFKVVISEYLEVAHAFFDSDEARLVNAVLDAIAGQARSFEKHQDKHEPEDVSSLAVLKSPAS